MDKGQRTKNRYLTRRRLRCRCTMRKKYGNGVYGCRQAGTLTQFSFNTNLGDGDGSHGARGRAFKWDAGF